MSKVFSVWFERASAYFEFFLDQKLEYVTCVTSATAAAIEAQHKPQAEGVDSIYQLMSVGESGMKPKFPPTSSFLDPTHELLERIYWELPNGFNNNTHSVSDSRHNSSTAADSEGCCSTDNPFLYGEVTPTGTRQLLQALQEAMRSTLDTTDDCAMIGGGARTANERENTLLGCFIDLGSGIGRLVLEAAMLCDESLVGSTGGQKASNGAPLLCRAGPSCRCHDSSTSGGDARVCRCVTLSSIVQRFVGIELDPIRHQIACRAHRDPTLSKPIQDKVVFLEGSFLDPVTWPLRRGTNMHTIALPEQGGATTTTVPKFLFVCGVGFDDSMCRQILSLVWAFRFSMEAAVLLLKYWPKELRTLWAENQTSPTKETQETKDHNSERGTRQLLSASLMEAYLKQCHRSFVVGGEDTEHTGGRDCLEPVEEPMYVAYSKEIYLSTTWMDSAPAVLIRFKSKRPEEAEDDMKRTFSSAVD